MDTRAWDSERIVAWLAGVGQATFATVLESTRAQALPVADVRLAPDGNDEAQARRQLSIGVES